MKLKKYNKIILTILLITNNLCGDQIITFFLKPFPKENNTQAAEKIAEKRVKKLGKVKKLPKYTLRAATQSHFTSGVFCTYGGYLAISDLNGQIIFPRKHKAPKITLIITKHIVPIVMLENTVHHWEISAPNKTKIYTIERKLDVAAKTHFWDVKEAEVPKDKIIPTDAIVIVAKPKHIYLPTGITITTKNPQLLLPDVYVKRGIEKLTSTLYIFGLKNLLMLTDSVYKKGKVRYTQKIKE